MSALSYPVVAPVVRKVSRQVNSSPKNPTTGGGSSGSTENVTNGGENVTNSSVVVTHTT